MFRRLVVCAERQPDAGLTARHVTGAFDEVFEAYRQEVEQSLVKSSRKQ
jgi:hypothetical protein